MKQIVKKTKKNITLNINEKIQCCQKNKWTTVLESLNMFLCYIVFVCISQCDVNHYGSKMNKKLKIFDNVQFCFAISYVTSYNNAKAINEHSLFGFCNKSREQG